MHQIATRPLTEHERSIVQVHAQTNFAAFGFLTVLLLVVPVVILLQLVGLAANSLSLVQLEALRLLAIAIPLIVYLAIIQSYWKRDRRRSQRAQQDLADNVVQEIAVTPSRVGEVTNKSDHPALAFEIGDEKILLLCGEWLYYANTYQAEAESGEVDPDHFNGLSGASGFPSTQFTVTRLPHSGYVFAIRVSGEYLDPSAEIATKYNDNLFRHSEILAGSLDNISEVLEIEQAQRRRGDML
ncbi:hypothetical protein M4951_24465 [Blastopirellula sp. J2-11]|uniref:hypothetical protein n=1 Tax=Blastopirellula sp. J2-11 TaxID=2943192 RepID=UPI0021C7FA4E|nr:hypothetical protein [Blastopirellula sp. J2-11]UUO06487.1 hypothetical protein M4951_24465 [Blastopirellula sp. J2-11]